MTKKKKRTKAAASDAKKKKKISRTTVDYSKMKITSNVPKGTKFKNVVKITMGYFGDELMELCTKKSEPDPTTTKSSKKKESNDDEPE